MLNELRAEGFDYVLCDSPAGIEKGAHLAMYFADRAIVVVNPEVSSVRDSDRILGLLASKTKLAEAGNGRVQEHLLLTRYSPRRVAAGEMMGVEDVKEILGLDVVGVIPESTDVLSASNAGTPVIFNEDSDVARAYQDAVARLLGETVPLRYIDEPKRGFFARLLEVEHGATGYISSPASLSPGGKRAPAHHRRAGNAVRAAARTTCRCCGGNCWK